MLSTCPNCLSQVNHADHLFDVTCECGAHFSPFLKVEEPNVAKNSSFSDYSESNSAFKEIVQFGEKLASEIDVPLEPMILKPSEKSVTNLGPISANPLEALSPSSEAFNDLGISAETPRGITRGTGKEMLITTGAELPGYGIETHFAPVSILAPFLPSSPNPISQGVQNLWRAAEAQGANGITGFHTILTSDGQNLLLIGIPVRCSKVV